LIPFKKINFLSLNPKKSITILKNVSFMFKYISKIFLAFSLFFLVPSPGFTNGLEGFNFQDVDIRTVIRSVAKLTGKSFLVDPKVKGKVTIISSQAMTEDELYGVFLSVLQVHGYAAVHTDKIIKIVPQSRAKEDVLPTTINQNYPVKPEDRSVTRLHKLKHVPADKLVAILRPLIPPKSYLAAHLDSNMLIISDRAGNIDRLLKIIRKIDQAGTGEIEVILLEHADARDVVTIIEGLEVKNKKIGKNKFRLIADDRTNSILLSGGPGRILRAKTLIAHLDTPIKTEGSTQVIFLRFAKAKDLVPILGGIKTDKKNKRKKNTSKSTEINIQADEATNALIITAPPSIMKSLQGVIRKLDIQRHQVLIEAIIVEVSKDNSAELGIQWRSTEDLTAGNSGFIGSSSFSGTAGSTTQGINQISLNPLAAGSGFALGYFDGTNSLLGTEVINLGALANIFAADGDSNILSTPSLVTMDNQEAEIVVGKNVPFVTGSYSSTGTATNPSNPFRTIERHDIGVKLKIKPQINEGNMVRLELDQEVSSLAPSSTQQGYLITNKRSIKTTVMLENGKILVLGGLIRDDLEEIEQRVPILGHIPILGLLFRYNRTTRTKTNLMVFIKPHIMLNDSINDKITFDKYDYMRRHQLNFETDRNSIYDYSETPLMPELEIDPNEF
jgi:general secretion pathway protein D